MNFVMVTILALGLASTSAHAMSILPEGAVASTYTSVRDKNSCRYEEEKDENGEPSSCSYTCNGPVEGITTQLVSCADWEHLSIQLNGKSYSTWEQMVSVGSWAGLGNEKGLVEWIGTSTGRGAITAPKALIVRFNGTNPDNGQSRSVLQVFGIEKDGFCLKGSSSTNSGARKIAINGSCVKQIEPTEAR